MKTPPVKNTEFTRQLFMHSMSYYILATAELIDGIKNKALKEKFEAQVEGLVSRVSPSIEGDDLAPCFRVLQVALISLKNLVEQHQLLLPGIPHDFSSALEYCKEYSNSSGS